VFENLGPLNKEEKEKIQAVKESVKSIAQSESIVADGVILVTMSDALYPFSKTFLPR